MVDLNLHNKIRKGFVIFMTAKENNVSFESLCKRLTDCFDNNARYQALCTQQNTNEWKIRNKSVNLSCLLISWTLAIH